MFDIAFLKGLPAQVRLTDCSIAGKAIVLERVWTGNTMRALLRNVYEDKNDFWHGGVPYNCAVSIIEVQNGVSTLLADNKIYYDPSDCVNFYKEVK